MLAVAGGALAPRVCTGCWVCGGPGIVVHRGARAVLWKWRGTALPSTGGALIALTALLQWQAGSAPCGESWACKLSIQ